MLDAGRIDRRGRRLPRAPSCSPPTSWARAGGRPSSTATLSTGVDGADAGSLAATRRRCERSSWSSASRSTTATRRSTRLLHAAPRSAARSRCCSPRSARLRRRRLRRCGRSRRCGAARRRSRRRRRERRLPLPARATTSCTRLGETLNEMLDRLDAGLERERRFVADASHELRTPLAILQDRARAARCASRARRASCARRSRGRRSRRPTGSSSSPRTCSCSRAPTRDELPIRREPVERRASCSTTCAAASSTARPTGAGRSRSQAPTALVLPGDRLRLEQALGEPRRQRAAPRRGRGRARARAQRDGDGRAARRRRRRRVPAGVPARMPSSASAAPTRRAAGGGAGLGLAIVERSRAATAAARTPRTATAAGPMCGSRSPSGLNARRCCSRADRARHRLTSPRRRRGSRRSSASPSASAAAPDEVAIAVAYLSGVLPQGTVGVGWAALRDLPAPPAGPTLELLEVDAAVSRLQSIVRHGLAGGAPRGARGALRAARPSPSSVSSRPVPRRASAGSARGRDGRTRSRRPPAFRLPSVRRAAMLAGDLVDGRGGRHARGRRRARAASG